MLIEFSVGNFLSFSEPVTFSMVAANPVKELAESNTFFDSMDKFRLLKTAALYGNNASGKSNFINSLITMQRIVLTSFQNSLNDKNNILSVNKFLLDHKYDNQPSLFEIVFVQNEKRYRYGFEILNGAIESEWLFYIKTSKEIQLFIREHGNIIFNNRSFKEGKDLPEKTKDNVLFLSVVAQFNGEVSNDIISWFKTLRTVSGLLDFNYQNYTIEQFSSNPEFATWAMAFLKFLKIEKIASEERDVSIKIERDTIKENEDLVELLNVIEKLTQKNKSKPKKLVSLHKRIDDNGIISTVKFDVETQESEGTKKLIFLLGPIYDVLKNGQILIIDELDSRFHPLLTMKLIEIFHMLNNSNAQLIFSSHDTNLLKNTVFRRDQIWFTEKKDNGSTDLYSLVEYKNLRVRKDATYNKDYLNGKYGAIPIFSDMEDFLNLIYG